MRVGIGMRWWLALAFAAVAATTAAAAAHDFSRRSEAAFRDRAQTIAAGAAVEAAIAVSRADHAKIADAVRSAAATFQLALFVVDRERRLVTTPESRGVAFRRIGGRDEAVRSALAGRRFIATNDEVQATVVALPLRMKSDGATPRHAIVAYARHPDLAAGVGIVREEIVKAASWAIALGALVGALIATLIALRLGRIGKAAAAIAAGDFSHPLRSSFRDEVGTLTVAIDKMRDRLQRSFEAVGAERDRLRTLLERLDEGVVAVDRDLNVEFANAAATRFVGALVPRRPLPDPWPSQSLREVAAALFRADAAAVDVTITPDEEHVYGLLGLPPRDNLNPAAVLVLTDLTERERRERAEREFVTNASHELRTPLTTILGAVEVLQAGAKDVPEDRDRFLGHIHREASRLVRLTRALLVLARAQTRTQEPRLAPLELRPLLMRIAESLTPPTDVEVEVRSPPGLFVVADPDLAEQAFYNLALNALDHTRRGAIVLAARSTGDGETAVEISDTGRGIEPRVAGRVFDRFYRSDGRSSENFGLGLAIVRQAVTAMGASISVDSVVGEGTTVTVRFRERAAEAA